MNVKQLFFLIFLILPLQGFKIDRVILASDANPMYLDFWPVAAKAWYQIIGVRPTLALIADASVNVDESFGDVMRFDPIPGVPTSLHAQCIRLLFPAYFPDDICIIADIDLLPLNKAFFVDSIAQYPDDVFMVFTNYTVGKEEDNGYFGRDFWSMNYNAAKGSTFAEIFDVTDVKKIPEIIIEWSKIGLGFFTDEPILAAYVRAWKHAKTRVVKLDRHPYEDGKRIDRAMWHYNKKLLLEGQYVDSFVVRPYKQFKTVIDRLLVDANDN